MIYAILTSTNTASACSRCLPSAPIPALPQPPLHCQAKAIILVLQAPFKCSLFKSRISLPFVLALAVKLESNPMISLIKKKEGDILISIPATILWPFVVSLSLPISAG